MVRCVLPTVPWGRRAEDPFRGLRAGPARTSPHFFSHLLRTNPSSSHWFLDAYKSSAG